VNSMTSLHQFAEKMLGALQHMDHMEVEESHYSQVTTSFVVLLHCYILLPFITVVVTIFV
jgi:hypothetical protein